MTGLLVLGACIVLLIVAVAVLKVHPIPALLIAGLILGLATGGTVTEVTTSLLNGFGDTLKWIGLIILFGTLLGEILAETGGSDVVADSVIKWFGIKYLPLSMAIIGFLIGIPVFMDVAYLTLLPTLVVLSKKSGHSVLVLGLSLAMSLTVAHALIPPTPGPLAVAAILEIDVGSIIPANVGVAIAAIIGGLAFILLNRNRLRVEPENGHVTPENRKPSLSGIKKLIPFAALLAPLVLMSLGTLTASEHPVIAFIKNPVWALLIGVVIALPLMGRKDFTSRLDRFFQTSASKSAIVILITGTGGAFGQVIKDTEIVNTLFADTGGVGALSIAVPFLLSFLFTTVTGSITVSLITSASIVAPLVTGGSMDPALTAAAIGAGSLGIIHVNSSFFWLFKEMHDLSVPKLLKSFSVLSAVTALCAGLLVLAVGLLMG